MMAPTSVGWGCRLQKGHGLLGLCSPTSLSNPQNWVTNGAVKTQFTRRRIKSNVLPTTDSPRASLTSPPNALSWAASTPVRWSPRRSTHQTQAHLRAFELAVPSAKNAPSQTPTKPPSSPPSGTCGIFTFSSFPSGLFELTPALPTPPALPITFLT